MHRILVADDEAIIREGIKCLFDYEELGFTICAEAESGEQTFEMIQIHRPDVVLLDIRMPGMTGLEVIRRARNLGYGGKVVIISSYTDFKYAQEAIRYGVQNYLTKPIDEDELKAVLIGFREALDKERLARAATQHYRTRARSSIVRDLLLGEDIPSGEDLKELNLLSGAYQAVLFRRPRRSSGEEIRLSNPDNSLYDHILLQDREVLLLKGESAIRKFRELAEFTGRANREDPDALPFFACGEVVHAPQDIANSFQQAQRLLDRQFFCEKEQYILDSAALPALEGGRPVVSQELVSRYSGLLLDCIQSFNRRRIAELLRQLQEELYASSDPTPTIKLFLTDLYLRIKEQMHHLYPGSEIPFFTNAAIIRTIDQAQYLSEVIWFYSKRFEVFMDATGTSNRDSVLDDVLHYIQHNYAGNITLETIAPLFGYNRSYLGKIFTKKMGQNFNSYVDLVRIEKSKELLLNDDMKVYTIAERVGYKNVDYFHIKFKKYVGQSPAEFRKKNRKQDTSCSPDEGNSEKGTLF